MPGKHVVVVGAGGLIGSHFVQHLGRIPGVRRVTLIDPDTYELANLAEQAILPDDVGKPKVRVQAARLAASDKPIEIEALPYAVEDVPLADLRGDAIVSCLDSRQARQAVNQIAWHLDVPWVDSGVLGALMLARVNVYLPAPDSPCIECAWSRDDYDALEQEYPCGAVTSSPTRSTSALGGLAASLAAIECQKILEAQLAQTAAGRQVTIDARWHKLEVTSFRRNPACRFRHEIWRIDRLRCDPGVLTVREAVESWGSLGVAGHRFVRELACPKCGRNQAVYGLNRPKRRCAVCGRRMASPAFDSRDLLDAGSPDEFLCRTLEAVGVRAGDVVRVDSGYREIVWEAA